MIIQSKFHDYYDSLAGQYRDTSIVYKRETRADPDLQDYFQESFGGLIRRQENVGYDDDHRVMILLFCGKIYPFYTNLMYLNTMVINKDGPKKTVFEYESPYEKFKSATINTKYWRYYNSLSQYNIDYKEGGIENPIANKVNKEIAPIIIISRGDNLINPRLQDFKFPMHAYQVLQNLMSFITPSEPKMIETSDKYKVLAAGFDKESFRREKGGPTRKRNRQ